MNNFKATFTFSSIAKSREDVKSQLPDYIHNFVVDNQEEFEEDSFHFAGVLLIVAESESELLEKLKTHRNSDLFEPYFTINLNGKIYEDSDSLPEKLAFLNP